MTSAPAPDARAEARACTPWRCCRLETRLDVAVDDADSGAERREASARQGVRRSHETRPQSLLYAGIKRPMCAEDDRERSFRPLAEAGGERRLRTRRGRPGHRERVHEVRGKQERQQDAGREHCNPDCEHRPRGTAGRTASSAQARKEVSGPRHPQARGPLCVRSRSRRAPFRLSWAPPAVGRGFRPSPRRLPT